MKYILSLFIVAFVAVNALAQRTEFSLKLNTGLASFSGESATDVATLLYNVVDEDGHVGNSLYGSNYGVSYGVSANIARILDSGLKLGAELGFEMLRAQLEINSVYEFGTGNNPTYPAEGDASINSTFANLFPHVGYRMIFHSFYMDFDAGLDLGYCLATTEKGSAETDARSYETSLDRKTIGLDMRPRAQVSVSGRNVGAYVGYSMGISNYLSEYTEGAEGAYLSVIRAGLIYTWKLRGKDHLKFRRRR